MAFSLRSALRHLLGPPPRLVCVPRVWNAGVDELCRRAGGQCESGAFLLGRIRGDTRYIEQFLFYDDIDPTCFARGIVEFDGRKLGAVWKICRDRGREIVADVHVHPGHYGQSKSDKRNPIMPGVGHIALILPEYAARQRMPGGIGLYEYLGSFDWCDHSVGGKSFFYIGRWPVWMR